MDPLPRRGAELRTFLIADIRGYTGYTEERGDQAAATLAAEFAELVEQVAGEFEGVLLEVRGDEALVVFFSARQALRAAVELQARTANLARPVGVGLDAGEAIPVGSGYRGTALNVAARLCAQAKGGEIVASEAVIHMAARIDGVAYVDARSVRLKGLEETVRAVTVVPESKVPRGFGRSARRAGGRLGDRLGGRGLSVILAGGLVIASALAVVLATGALGPGPFGGPTPRPSPPAPSPAASADFSIAAPAMAILDVATGGLFASVPARSPGDRAVFADGSFWQLETEPSGILRIDPTTGRVTQTFGLPLRDPGGFTVDATTLWVADRTLPRVVRIDSVSGTELPELRLTRDPDDVNGANDVVVAGGSVWVTRPDPGEVIRLDPQTGRVVRSLSIDGASLLAVDENRIWVLSRNGRLTSIDVASGDRSDIRLRLPDDDYHSLAVGAGSVWTAGRRKGTVYRITRAGQLEQSFETGAGAQAVSFADGTLWVGNQHAGTVSAIDALTGGVRRTATGHTVVGVVAGAGRVLVGVVPTSDPFARLEGTTLRVAIDGDPLAVFDPPLISTAEMYAISDATCAKLLRYPDRPAPEGWALTPEIAADTPTVSDDGRTYTFTIRDGYTFFPSGEAITADTVRGSLERALSPGFGPEFTFANALLGDIEGTSPFAAGLADHIDGIVAEGDRLSIRLQSRAEDFLTRLALPQFCIVPPTIRAVPGGVNPASGLPSAGPYYLASKERDAAILKRNPTYPGPRTARFDNIAIRLNEDVRTSIAQIDSGQLDYVLSYGNDALDPQSELARAFGPGSPEPRYFNAPTGDVFYLSIRPSGEAEILHDASVRRAVALALDRPRLAALFGWSPAYQLLTPRTLGYEERDPPPIDGPDLEGARSLMAGRTGNVRLVYDEGCDECAMASDVIRQDLAAIDLTLAAEAVANPAGEDADLALWFHGYPDIDPVRFLDYLPTSGLYTELSPEDGALVAQLGFLTGEVRITAAAALADRWAIEQAIMVPIAYGVSGEYFSTRVGCQIFPPSIFSVDLVTLCPKDG